ncbi:hypothetical protein FH966_12170 [Lentibacillus cibarius]|uniref:Flagellar hook-length control protein FliK n=1 Tax=Lentibacillus cibarius TaxID=2583219 RepID=A0A549YKJ3_9BACI|nr:hypothetical protein [Lentibacillus cibarius]TRM12384.1 hypothetical protein FH966_12170 [Lentibacillus cibarius]
MRVQQLPGNRVSRSMPQALQPGQIVQGKIMKLYANQTAQIQLGSRKMIAQLEASLTVGGRYHFQVQPSDELIHLRVIGGQLPTQGAGDEMELLKQLGFKASKSHADLVQTLNKEKIPFTKEQLQGAFRLLNESKNTQQTQQIIRYMFAAGLPITRSIYQAMASVRSIGMTEQMTLLLNQLRRNPNPSNLYQKLTYQLQQILEPSLGKSEDPFLFASPKEQFLNHVRQVLQFTGLNDENVLATNRMKEQHTIKSMLLQFLQQGDGAAQEQSRKLLHFLNGMQLQSVQETANVLQAHLQLPGAKLGLSSDMDMQFTGNKTEDGTISTDSCRILFYLELTNLKETIVDMHIQKRAVIVTIYNDHEDLRKQSTSLKPKLKEGLKQLDYQLSTLTFQPINEKNQLGSDRVKTAYPKSYQGVDYRI